MKRLTIEEVKEEVGRMTQKDKEALGCINRIVGDPDFETFRKVRLKTLDENENRLIQSMQLPNPRDRAKVEVPIQPQEHERVVKKFRGLVDSMCAEFVQSLSSEWVVALFDAIERYVFKLDECTGTDIDKVIRHTKALSQSAGRSKYANY